MACTSLFSLPEEILIFLSEFLLEEDVFALSDTCVYLKNILNCNKVWERFITEDMKQVSEILKTQEQQVSPAFVPEPGLCEAKLNVLRKNHLLDNWRNGRCEVQEPSECNIKIEEQIQVVFYKEEFLFIVQRRGNIQVEMWDIRIKPILADTILPQQNSILLVIRDYLVILHECIVDVYQINVEAKCLTFSYSFSIPEGKVMNGSKPSLSCEHDDNCHFQMIKVKDLLVFSPLAYDSYRICLWDITNAQQVGKFVLQSQFGLEPISYVLYSTDNQVILKNKQMYQDISYYVKFDIVTRGFSETLFTDCLGPTVLFYNKHCLRLTQASSDTLVYEFIELPSCVEVKKRRFVNVCPWFMDKSIIVTSGKIVIPCSDVYHVISASNLETEVIIPHNASSVQSVCPVNVCGQLFLLTVENKNEVKVWDVETAEILVCFCQPWKLPFLNTLFKIKEGSQVFGRERNWIEGFYNISIYVEEENISHLHTKMVVLGKNEITVVHFW